MDSVEGAEGVLFQVHLAVAAHAVHAPHLPASSARAAVEEHSLPQFRLPLCICACSQCAETLSEEVLGKMHAPPKNEAVPVIDTYKLPEADGAFCFRQSFPLSACTDSVHSQCECVCRLPLRLPDPVCRLFPSRRARETHDDGCLI